MRRRSFLKTLGAGVGFLMMPELILSANTSISNCADLTAAMESMFTCSMGEPRAFMELTTEQARRFLTPAAYSFAVANAGFTIEHQEKEVLKLYNKNTKGYYDAMAELTPPDGIIRLTYQTFAYAIEGGTAAEAEKKLSNYFYDQLKALDDNDKKMLIWRIKPHFESETVTRFGNVWMTYEQIEDRVDLNKDLRVMLDGYKHGVYGRINTWAYQIPRREDEPPIMVPEGVEYDFDTGALRYVKEKVPFHKLRMRMVIPEMSFEMADLEKPQGEPMKVIEL